MRLARHSLACALLAGASFANSGCASDDGAEAVSPGNAKEARLARKLEGDTGVAWKVFVERQSNTVRFLAPVTATDSATPGASLEDGARAFLREVRC